MATYNKVCKICGKEFVAINHRSAYCSENCRIRGLSENAHRAYMKKVYGEVKENVLNGKRKVCPICGKAFFSSNSAKYCSYACSWKAKQLKSQRKKKPNLSANGTLCWHCKWATGLEGHCPWARSFTPVDGWGAKKVKLKVSTTDYTDSYIVKECPLFEEG